MAGGGTPDWHMDQLRERQAYSKNWKKRQGGINPKLGQRMWANQHDRDKWEGKQKLWEAAAWEMGMGNVKDKKDLKKLKDRYKELGIKDFDSMSDAKSFRKSNDEQIDELVNARFDEWTKNQQAQQGGQQANRPDGMEPQVVGGANDFRSQYAQMLMSGSPYLQYGMGPRSGAGNGASYNYTPRGGW